MAPSTASAPSQKRKADSLSPEPSSSSSPPTKQKKTTPKTKKSPTSKPPIYTAVQLSALPHADLLAHAIALQTQLSTPASQDLSPADLAKKVSHLQSLMHRQIKKAMVWKPTCKTGSASFSQDFIVPNEMVLKELFKPVIKEGGKPWKMKKFGVDDFEEVVGTDIQASSRYVYLVLTDDVTVRWDKENGTLKCSGKYGKMGTERVAQAMPVADGEK